MEVKALSPTAERQTDRDRSVPGFRRQESSSALEKLHGFLAGWDLALALPKPFLSLSAAGSREGLGMGRGVIVSSQMHPTSATCLRSPCSYKWVQVIPAECPVDRMRGTATGVWEREGPLSRELEAPGSRHRGRVPHLPSTPPGPVPTHPWPSDQDAQSHFSSANGVLEAKSDQRWLSSFFSHPVQRKGDAFGHRGKGGEEGWEGKVVPPA